jgi:hypothetical protein
MGWDGWRGTKKRLKKLMGDENSRIVEGRAANEPKLKGARRGEEERQ